MTLCDKHVQTFFGDCPICGISGRLEAERDRYKAALEKIAQFPDVSADEVAWIAKEALNPDSVCAQCGGNGSVSADGRVPGCAACRNG